MFSTGSRNRIGIHHVSSVFLTWSRTVSLAMLLECVFASAAIASNPDQRAFSPGVLPITSVALPTSESPQVAQLETTASSVEPMPDWVTAPIYDNENKYCFVVSSRPATSRDSAEQDALETAIPRVRRRFNQTIGSNAAWDVPHDVIRNRAVKRIHVRQVAHDFDTFTADMYQVFMQIELKPKVTAALRRAWRSQVVEKRSSLLLTIVGFLSFAAVTTTAWLRLEPRCHGWKRFVLRGTSATLLAGTCLTLTGLADDVGKMVRPPEVDVVDSEIDPKFEFDSSINDVIMDLNGAKTAHGDSPEVIATESILSDSDGEEPSENPVP